MGKLRVKCKVVLLSMHINMPTAVERPARGHVYMPIASRELRCCGAANFTDYEHVFSNFSVPVSCCDTTNTIAKLMKQHVQILS